MELPDTMPSFDMAAPAILPAHESQGEYSQNTIPIMSAEEETRPNFDSREILARVRHASTRTFERATEATGISGWLLFFMATAISIVIGVIIAMLTGEW
jgi:hypothetical protein